MDGLYVLLLGLFGVFSSSQEWISGSEVTVTPGENITLYCDCRLATGVYIVWYRNCSQENQPTLVLRITHRKSPENDNKDYGYTRLPRLEVVRNFSSNTYDLLISNITHSEEGFYYCGTEESLVEDKEKIHQRYSYTYGNVTRIVFDPVSKLPQPNAGLPSCDVCWMLLFSLCSVSAVVSALLSSLLVYLLCRKKEFQDEHQIPEAGGQTRLNEDGDVCYAALDIRHPSQRPRRKTQSSDFSVYSAIKTSKM